jgi:hypothetical protein
MTSDTKDDDRPAGSSPTPRPEQEDQLSPTRALRKSVGASGSQRLGDSGPVANPEVSFPDDADAPAA